jgi:HlyD family secretion protein
MELKINGWAKRVVFVLILAGLIAVAASWSLKRGNTSSVSFRTVQVKRGDLVATISATGTVEPEEVVDVGAQVIGRIVAFGKDKSGKTIDYGSMVEKGTVLAQIDDSLYAAEVSQVKAQMQQAKAGVLRAEADLGQMQAKLFQAERDWKRAQELSRSELLSQSERDSAFSAYEVAKANLSVGKAALIQAKDGVALVEATLRRAQQNLDYCAIRSPVKGIIIDRRVNIGQTVVSSLNAPSLFLIAKDLRRMQVWVSVNEADTGSIHPGQAVSFTVDAFPAQLFQGVVGKIRLNATMTQNVVTYTVEVLTDNSSGKLLPYLTANVKFMVSRRNDVLLLPNAALRWTPQPGQTAPDSGGRAGTARTVASRPATPGQVSQDEYARGIVWLPSGSFARSVPVRVGLSDGVMTEVQGEELKEGTPVVTGEEQKQSPNPSPTASPFTPQLRGSTSQPRR